MGPGYKTVHCISTEGADVAVGRWADGRLGAMRGLRQGTHDYGFTAFCERAVVSTPIDVSAIYYDLLKRIVGAFQMGQAPLGPKELIEPVSFMEAALQSAAAGGAEVALLGGEARGTRLAHAR